MTPSPAPVNGAVATLTDGTGVSPILGSKLVKDIVLDFLLAAPGALVAVNVANLEQAVAMPVVVGFALGDVVIRVVYRAALRWAQSE